MYCQNHKVNSIYNQDSKKSRKKNKNKKLPKEGYTGNDPMNKKEQVVRRKSGMKRTQ